MTVMNHLSSEAWWFIAGALWVGFCLGFIVALSAAYAYYERANDRAHDVALAKAQGYALPEMSLWKNQVGGAPASVRHDRREPGNVSISPTNEWHRSGVHYVDGVRYDTRNKGGAG